MSDMPIGDARHRARTLLRLACTLSCGLLALAARGAAPATGARPAPAAATASDPYLWLEDVDGEKALAWVRGQNNTTAKKLESQPLYQQLYRDARTVLDSESRLPTVTQRGKWLYNFWKDEQHPRGIYRRTTLDQFRQEKPSWQTVVDVDALATSEGKPWVWKGMECL